MRIRHSFSLKISLLFLGLLFIMGAAQALLTIRIGDTRRAELDQLVNWDLAEQMSGEVKPFLDDEHALKSVEPAIHYMMVLNPNIEVYILGKSGEILAWFMDGDGLARTKVTTTPLESFIRMEKKAPILGEDPRSNGGTKPFSVAEISFGNGSSGYLYVILRSSIYDRAEAMGSEKVLTRTLGTAFLFSLLIVGILGLALFYSLTRRIRLLTRGAHAIEEGDLSRRIELSGDDEVGELTAVFNRMAATLQTNIEELKQTDRLHRELAANISHDLRSPLTSIQGYLETLSMKWEDLPPEEGRHYLEIITGESRKLKTLIDDLFQLSLLESDQVSLQQEIFSLTELLQDEILLYAAKAEPRGIDVRQKLPRQLLPVRGDLKLIRRVVTNLLDNALQYSPAGGTIGISAESAPGSLRVEIENSGPGIPEDEIPHIFQRFYRGSETSPSGSREGSGLGLAIASRIIELHGGEIGVASTSDQGSRFFFTLPALSQVD